MRQFSAARSKHDLRLPAPLQSSWQLSAARSTHHLRLPAQLQLAWQLSAARPTYPLPVRLQLSYLSLGSKLLRLPVKIDVFRTPRRSMSPQRQEDRCLQNFAKIDVFTDKPYWLHSETGEILHHEPTDENCFWVCRVDLDEEKEAALPDVDEAVVPPLDFNALDRKK